MAAVHATLKRRSWIAVLAVTSAAAAVLGAQSGARRIVSVVPATTEMLFAMGAGDRVVAAGTYDRYPPEVERLPRVGGLLDPNVERIIALRPDLVVLHSSQTDLSRQLARAGIPCYSYAEGSLADIPATIRMLGVRVGLAAQAASLASDIERRLQAIRARIAGRPRPRTLVVFGREPGSLRNIEASGGEGFLHDMLEAAGGADVLADIRRESVMMTTEMVLARAPEVIIELRYTGAESAGDDVRPWEALGAVPAVRNHRVYLLRGDEFVVPGPRIVGATERLAHTLHPEVFR